MPILTLEEVEPYRDLRLPEFDMVDHRMKHSLERLKLFERELITRNDYGLPFYLAYEHHINGRTIKDLVEELCVNVTLLTRMFGNYGIPRLTNSETRQRYLKKQGYYGKNPEKIRKEKEREKSNDKKISLLTSKVVEAYDGIMVHTSDVENWRKLINPVSEKTGIEPEFVRSCLEDLFETKS